MHVHRIQEAYRHHTYAVPLRQAFCGEDGHSGTFQEGHHEPLRSAGHKQLSEYCSETDVLPWRRHNVWLLYRTVLFLDWQQKWQPRCFYTGQRNGSRTGKLCGEDPCQNFQGEERNVRGRCRFHCPDDL